MGSYRIAPGGDVKCRKENTVNNVAINVHSVSGGTGLRAVGGEVEGGVGEGRRAGSGIGVCGSGARESLLTWD